MLGALKSGPSHPVLRRDAHHGRRRRHHRRHHGPGQPHQAHPQPRARSARRLHDLRLVQATSRGPRAGPPVQKINLNEPTSRRRSRSCAATQPVLDFTRFLHRRRAGDGGPAGRRHLRDQRLQTRHRRAGRGGGDAAAAAALRTRGRRRTSRRWRRSWPGWPASREAGPPPPTRSACARWRGAAARWFGQEQAVHTAVMSIKRRGRGSATPTIPPLLSSRPPRRGQDGAAKQLALHSGTSSSARHERVRREARGGPAHRRSPPATWVRAGGLLVTPCAAPYRGPAREIEKAHPDLPQILLQVRTTRP